MSGAIPPLPQYAFMACYSIKKKAQGQFYLYLTLPYLILSYLILPYFTLVYDDYTYKWKLFRNVQCDCVGKCGEGNVVVRCG